MFKRVVQTARLMFEPMTKVPSSDQLKNLLKKVHNRGKLGFFGSK